MTAATIALLVAGEGLLYVLLRRQATRQQQQHAELVRTFSALAGIVAVARDQMAENMAATRITNTQLTETNLALDKAIAKVSLALSHATGTH